jgi:hypothetical protein
MIILSTLFKKILRAFSLLTLRAREEAWLVERRRQVIECLTHDVCPLKTKPYISGGTFNWFVEEPVRLDFYFPDENLAVRVAGRHYGPWDAVSEYTPSRKFWEARTKYDFFLQDVCARGDIPFILVSPDDPINPFAFAVKLRELGIPKKQA